MNQDAWLFETSQSAQKAVRAPSEAASSVLSDTRRCLHRNNLCLPYRTLFAYNAQRVVLYHRPSSDPDHYAKHTVLDARKASLGLNQVNRLSNSQKEV